MDGTNAETGSTPNCVACRGGRVSSRDYAVEGRFPLLRCEDCGMQFLAIDETPDEDFDEYWDEVAGKVYQAPSVIEELRRKYRRYFPMLSRLAPNRRFLDVGSGAGIGVDTARREFGFDAKGIEPSSRAIDIARSRMDGEFVHGLLRPDSDIGDGFGVLTLWDVIEHVEDPEALLGLCADRLAPGGAFLLETPAEGTLLRRAIDGLGTLGVEPLDLRSSIYYRGHRYYFTREAMRQLMERCGFQDIRFHTEHSMYQKELLYMEHYGTSSAMKRLAIHVTASLADHVPALGNKMVVTAVKSSSR